MFNLSSVEQTFGYVLAGGSRHMLVDCARHLGYRAVRDFRPRIVVVAIFWHRAWQRRLGPRGGTSGRSRFCLVHHVLRWPGDEGLPAIPFWNSALLPVLCLTYATLGGATLSLMVTALQGGMPPPVLEQVEHWLLAVNACLLATYAVRMSRLEPAARETVRFLLRGRYRRAFLGLVLLVGLMATLFLSPAQSRVEETSLAVVVAACELVGDFTLLMVLSRRACIPRR